MQEHKVRPVFFYNIYGTLGGKFVHLGRFHPAEHMLVALKNLFGLWAVC